MEAPRPLPGSWRLRVGHLARGLCLGALTLALLGPATAPAGAAVGPGALVTGPGGTAAPVSEAAIKAVAEHEPVRLYILRATSGEAGQEVPRQGVPVRKVIEMAHLSLAGGYLTVPRPNGTAAYLPAEYFEEPSPFENELPAVISTDEGSVRFFRPLLASEPDGVNAEDNIATVSGEALTIGVHEGDVAKVQVSSASASTSAGSPVGFTAAATGGLEGETFTYHWTFGDGMAATTVGSEPASHAFSGSGTYQVRVTAIGSLESGGESGPVEVVVANPPTADAPGAATTPQPTTKKPTGAPGKGRDGRGGNGSKPAPSGGHRRKKGRDDSSAQRGGSPAGRSHPDGSAEAAPAVPTSVPPEVPTTFPPPAALPLPEEPSPSAPGGEAPAESVSPTARAPSPPSTTEGELVEGRLVGDDLGPTTLEEAVGGSSEGEGSRSAPGALGDGGVGVPVGALIVVALLAGGALFEWRRSRPAS